MALGHKLWILCSLCGGTGKTGDPSLDVDICQICNGSKYLFHGWMHEDKEEMPANLPELIED